MAKRVELTIKQRKFVDALKDPNTGSISEAGRKAGWKDVQQPYRTLKSSPIVRNHLQDFLRSLEGKGINDKYIISKIKDGLNATDKRFFANNGVVTDEREVPDYAVRHKYLDTVVKIKRLISDEQITDNRKQLVIVLGDGGSKDNDII